MPCETTLFAVPLPVSWLMLMPTCRTLATCSSFRAGEAHHVSLFAFVGEVVDITPIFPQTHTLVVMSPSVLIADAMRIANKERPDLSFDTEVNHFAGRLVVLVANASFGTSALLVLGTL